MWHDFEEYSHGCGASNTSLFAGEDAMRVARQFLLQSPRLSLALLHSGNSNGSGGGGTAGGSSAVAAARVAGGGWAPIAWVSNFSKRPPVAEEQCNDPGGPYPPL